MEALVVDQLEKGLEALGVAVVRCRAEKEPMLEVGCNRCNSSGPFGGDRLRPPRGGHVVGLVDDQEVEAPGIGPLAGPRQHLLKPAHLRLPLQEVDGRDEPREVGPRIREQPSRSSQLLEQLGVNYSELQAEFLAHLVAPLELEPGRANDEHVADPVAKDQLLHDEPGLDGLS